MHARKCTALFFMVFAAACESTGPDEFGELNLLLNNQTGRAITVVLQIDGSSMPGVNLSAGGFMSDAFEGGRPGQAIGITATTNDGAPVLSANRQCTPREVIFGGAAYGQIDFASFAAGGAGILCQDPATWQ